MVARTRLSRSSKLSNSDDRLKRDVVGQLKKMSTERVKKYATLSTKYVGENPVLGLTKSLAQQELAERQTALATWAHGKQVLRPHEPFFPKVAKGAQKAFQMAGKGSQEFFKIISGEKAHEVEEAIATAGMKPEDKKKYLEQMAAERAAREKEESFELIPAEEPEFMRPKKAEPEEEEPDLEPFPLVKDEPEEFNLAKEQAELSKELEISRREAFGIERAPRKKHHKKKRAKSVVRYVPMYQPYPAYQQPMMVVRR